MTESNTENAIQDFGNWACEAAQSLHDLLDTYEPVQADLTNEMIDEIKIITYCLATFLNFMSDLRGDRRIGEVE